MRRRNKTLLVLLLGAIALVSFLVLRPGSGSAPMITEVPELAEVVEDDVADDDVANDDVEPAVVDAALAASAVRALLGEVSDPAGAPIAGATVTATLEDGSTEVRVTDGEGVFTLDALRAPLLRVRFTAPGYAEASVERARLPAVPEAFWSQKLTPSFTDGAGRVEGVVVDSRGAPVTEYRLMATPAAVNERGRRTRTALTEVSDDTGAFSKEATGKLALVVIAPGFRPSEALVVNVEPGRVERVRIALERSNALTGRVTNAATGAPVAGAVLAIDHVHGIEPAVTNADGRYRIASLPREKASLLVRAEGFVELTTGGVEGGRSRDEVLDIKLTPKGDGAAATEVVGIGVGVRGGPDGVRVTEVFSNGPANGVLEQGDVIVEVDGVSLVGKPLREGMSAIRGESGSTIRMAVKRKDGSTKSVSLERARVSVPEG